MIGLALALAVAIALWVAGSPEAAVVVFALYAVYAIWRHHRRSTTVEKEIDRQEAEERSEREEEERLLDALRRARERRMAEPAPGVAAAARRRSSARLRAIRPTEGGPPKGDSPQAPAQPGKSSGEAARSQGGAPPQLPSGGPGAADAAKAVRKMMSKDKP